MAPAEVLPAPFFMKTENIDMKKLFATILAAAMLTGLLGGCGGTTPSAADTGEKSAAETTDTVQDSAPAATPAAEQPEDASNLEESTVEEVPGEMTQAQQLEAMQNLVIENPYTFPLVDTDTTVTMWCDLIPPLFNAMPNGMSDNMVLQELQKRTGITLDITSTAITGAADAVSLQVASGDYPEIWSGFGSYYSGGISEAIEQEIILDLAEYKENFPSYFEILDNYPIYGKNAYTDDGNVGVLNGIWTNPVVDVGLMVRQDYLDELGLDTPKTLDDFYEALTAMKDKYGAYYYMNQDSSDPVNSFAQCFDVVGNASSSSTYAYYMAKNGEEVVFSPLEDGFKDYLETMAKWYSEGLIYTDFLSAPDAVPSSDILLGGDIGVTYYNAASYTTLMSQVEEGSTFKLTPVEPPVNVETGEPGHLGRLVDYVSPKGYSLSTALEPGSEKFQAVCSMLDYLYTNEGSELMNYGMEDVTFTYDENGDHVWTDLMVNNPDGLAYSWCISRYTFGAGSFRIDSSRTLANYGDEEMHLIEVWNDGAGDTRDVLPTSGLSLTSDEATTYAAGFSDIRTHAQQNILAFITGSRPVSEYDTFVEELNAMDVDACTQILQDALDRYNQR